MSLAFIDPEINAFEFHDLDKDMSNIPDGSTGKSNHEIHQNFVIFGLSIVENNRVTHFRETFPHHKSVHSKGRFLQKSCFKNLNNFGKIYQKPFFAPPYNFRLPSFRIKILYLKILVIVYICGK